MCDPAGFGMWFNELGSIPESFPGMADAVPDTLLVKRLLANESNGFCQNAPLPEMLKISEYGMLPPVVIEPAPC